VSHAGYLGKVICCALAPLAVSYSDWARAQTPSSAAGFEVSQYERVIDLSGWRPIAAGQERQKISKTVWRDRLRVKRLERALRALVCAMKASVRPAKPQQICHLSSTSGAIR